jgi:hypothetical protein
MSSPNIIDKGPRVADYSAGNPHGPSHQPALFNTEQAPAWVVPFPLQYPSPTASPRPPHKSNVFTADSEDTTAWSATTPMRTARRASAALPPVLTPISVTSARPGTSPADAAEALRASLQGFCSPTTRMWGSPLSKITSMSMMAVSNVALMNPSGTASFFAPTLLLQRAPPHIGTASNYRPPLLPSRPRQKSLPGPSSSHGSVSTTPLFLRNGEKEEDWSTEA